MNQATRWSIAILAVGMCVFPTGGLAKTRTDREKHELIGSVRTVITRYPDLAITETYDPSGSLTEIVVHAAGENHTGKTLFIHDADGHVQEERAYDANGSLISKKLYRYSYDHEGKERAIVAATDGGDLVHALFSEYDPRGHLVEELHISSDGAMDKSLFDVRGDVVYTARYHSRRLMFERVNRYDPQRRVQESRLYSGEGALIRQDLFRYAETGLQIEEISEFYHRDHMRRLITTYDLDSAGNWVKEIVTRWIVKDGETKPTDNAVHRERTITYYH